MSRGALLAASQQVLSGPSATRSLSRSEVGEVGDGTGACSRLREDGGLMEPFGAWRDEARKAK